jgi:hypothetical protein
MQCTAEVYQPSYRVYTELPDVDYPFHDKTTTFGGQLYGLRSRLHRSRGKDSAALKQLFWPKGVKYVFGTFCNASLRTVQKKFGGREGIRTPDPLLAKQVLSQLSYTPVLAASTF